MAPPDEMSNEQRLDQLALRVDEHGNRIEHIEARQNSQGVRLERHDQILVGDPQLGLVGVQVQLREISDKLQDISEWKSQVIAAIQFAVNSMTIVAKIVVALLGMIGFGVWWPELVSFYHWLIGG